MFGFPCAFVNGQMFAGLFEEHMNLRLPEEGRDELIALGGAPFEPMPGRPMKEYVVVPQAIVADGAALRGWGARAFTRAQPLGPTTKAKAKPAPKAKATSKAKAAPKRGR